MNYQHLFYFRTVAVLGGITAAAQQLRLTPPTLSAQIRTLEESVGVQLFDRSARGMSLTDAGRVALRYADRIFALGAELEHVLRGDQAERVVRVGVEASIMTATVRPLLSRLAAGSAEVASERLVCSFGPHEQLFTALRALDLDVVLTGAPLSDPTVPELASRLVLETEVAFFADTATADALRAGFPSSLDGASFIAPPKASSLRESLERWLGRMGVALVTNVELGDASLASALAADGVGIIAAPLSAGVELTKRYGLALVGVADGVRAQLYAVGMTEKLDDVLPALLEVQLQNDDDTAPEVASSPRPLSLARPPSSGHGMTARVQRESVR
ncbi:MAG: Transcriptional regulator, LysR family protein [Labilithrix sp.]|nr:Transcriptional regulator, LysR family protein [Labilithrix sp.]